MIEDFRLFAELKKLPEETIKIIENVRQSPPSRAVRSGKGNVSGKYPSVKMGVSIQFESHTLELANICLKEHDSNVLEFYDQPPKFPIQYLIKDKNGKVRNSGGMYTPDLFVIEKDWIGWEECKKEEELIRLAIESPNKYLLDEDGVWRCPPAEEYAESFGLSFRVISDRDIDRNYLRNINFLEDYLLYTPPVEDLKINNAIIDVVSNKPGMRLESLFRDYSFEADSVYTALIYNHIYVDLYKHVLAEPHNVEIYSDKNTALAYANMRHVSRGKEFNSNIIDIEPGNTIVWDGRKWTFINVGESSYSLMSEDDKLIDLPVNIFLALLQEGKIKGIETKGNSEETAVLEILKTTTKDQLEAANQRFSYIMRVLNHEEVRGVPQRTLDDWLNKYRVAENKFGNGYVGLIDQRVSKGNRVPRYSEKVVEILERYITDYYETIIQRNRSTVYKLAYDECKSQGLTPPSLRTFCEMVKHRLTHEQTRKRKGSKAAYATEGFYWELEQSTPRHGDRPFEIAHIDHTELDIEIVCSKTGRNLGRPWATFMVDAFSRRLLAVYITFDPPSYRSCMMVLRECVRKHQRLPKKIVVDGGKEFRSTYFETLLAWYKVTKLQRPGAKPRFGSVCERLFGTVNTTFINNLLGNTQATKNVRQVTSEVNPKKHAVWTLGAFFERLCDWAYELYDTTDHPALGCTPREACLNGIALAGKRKFTMISYNETFEMLTLPTTRTGKAKVEPGYGVKINYSYYWSDRFLNPEIETSKVSVRYDPYNMGIAYAQIGQQWIQLISNHYSVFANKTEKEVRQAAEEIKRRAKLHGKQISVSAAKLADFLRSAEAEEALLKQRLRDNEQKNVFEVIEGGKGNKKQESVPLKDNTNVVSIPKLKKVKKSESPKFSRLEEF